MRKLVLSALLLLPLVSWANDHCQLTIHNSQQVDNLMAVQDTKILQTYEYQYHATCDKHAKIRGMEVRPQHYSSTESRASLSTTYHFDEQYLDTRRVQLDMHQAPAHRYFFENANEQPQIGRTLEGKITIALSGLFVDNDSIHIRQTLELVLITDE